LKFSAEANLGELICFDYGWTAVEMAGPEIVVFNAVLKLKQLGLAGGAAPTATL
jgi:hypothetical protein